MNIFMDLMTDSKPEDMAQAPHSNTIKGFPKEIFSKVEEKFLCAYCENILREPMQSDCGHRYCNGCKQELARLTSPVRCKACIAEQVSDDESILNVNSMFEDKAAIREMKKLDTKCINQGCQWKGMFMEYLTHENNCDKKLVICQKCGQHVTQVKLTNHEIKHCPKRIAACQYCKQEMLFEDVEKHVNQSCPNLPVKCDKCQKLVPKNEIKSHKEDECVHRIFECPLPDCNTKISFEQFPSHVGKNTPKHVVYLLARIHVLEKQINALDTKLAVGTDSAAAGAVGGAQSVPASHMAGAEGGVSPLSMEDKQQLKLHEDLMAVLHGEILRCIKQVEAMNKKMETQLKSIQENSTKIRELESRGFSATATNQSLPDPLEKGTLIDGKDGMITWRLEHFSGVRRDAVNNVQHCICSPSFFSGPVGYKMRVRLFTNGDGEAKGKSISAFIQLMPGPHDDLLPWPFNGKIYFMIVDQKNFRDHKMVSFSALPDQQAFQKPHNEPNIASGLPNLITVTEFSNNQDKYAVGDVLYMRVCVDLHDSVKDKLNTLNPKSFSRRS
ncbi:TNF receptor-associated factor 2 [Biomphalaria pfeifferi]|uniref:TNF receptor-associated factor 2 n=1 Tax=Biomphalaria pfeifferi TaxID=112525 RepID=A0AAD8C0G5_BIOPF|nr:TNF receptor-associated factor 2 [Biomphalaria pfeifferi]